jgi:hypothetical protein
VDRGRRVELKARVSARQEEEREGVSANLVLILEREHGLRREAAIREAAARVDAEMRAFLHLEAALAQPVSRVTRLYVQGMQAWMRGCADWHTLGQRYRSNSTAKAA